MDKSYVIEMEYHAAVAARDAQMEKLRPSVLFRPSLSIDGNQWCALYGEDLQSGVAGFGDSPELAMRAFDAAFAKPLATPKEHTHDN